MVTFFYGGRRYHPPVVGAAALEIQRLSVAHPGAAADALHEVSLTVAAGERIALVGANGAGKSTLLKAIAGLLPIRSGSIAIYGLPVGACHHRVAYLPQRGEIDWRFPISLRRLVLTGRYVHLGWVRRPKADDYLRTDAAIAQMDLTNLAERQIGELSGGQQQRALFARTLAQDADLLLLDEPFNAVDVATQDRISAVIGSLPKQGKTALVATHDVEQIERTFDRTIRLHQGQIEHS